MTDPSSLTLIHRELFVWFAHRQDVRSVNYSITEITLAPIERLREDGSPWPSLVRITISLQELTDAWPALLSGSQTLGLNKATDLDEIGAFSLLDVHLDEAVNSLREPGPNGYQYTKGSFRPH